MNEKLNNVKLSISDSNRKMGAIPSVSLPPVVTCPAGCPCAKKCYAARMCKRYPNVREAYNRNLDLLNEDWAEYWKQVNARLAMVRFFRFHVSGDIPNAAYFKEMTISARKNPHCEILAFTKQYDIVNHYIDSLGPLPKNLHIVFSAWDVVWNAKIQNPHNLPTSAVIFKGEEWKTEYFDKICPGNCYDCAARGCGCWTLEDGETIGFMEH